MKKFFLFLVIIATIGTSHFVFGCKKENKNEDTVFSNRKNSNKSAVLISDMFNHYNIKMKITDQKGVVRDFFTNKQGYIFSTHYFPTGVVSNVETVLPSMKNINDVLDIKGKKYIKNGDKLLYFDPKLSQEPFEIGFESSDSGELILRALNFGGGECSMTISSKKGNSYQEFISLFNDIEDGEDVCKKDDDDDSNWKDLTKITVETLGDWFLRRARKIDGDNFIKRCFESGGKPYVNYQDCIFDCR
ncbi:MAG: hypothetical protein ACEPOW_03705 [Bacteroidales bacterium]